jgi:hypothetical protein
MGVVEKVVVEEQNNNIMKNKDQILLENLYENILLKDKHQIHEAFDNPYRWKHTFKTEEVTQDWDESGEEYAKNILQPVQIINFQTDDGIPYIWYAKQNRYDDNNWEIAFGMVEDIKPDGSYKTNIEKTGSGNAFRVFATVIEITNSFIEYDEDNYEVQTLTVKSKGDNRTSLYKKYIIPRLENFQISDEQKDGDETEIHLQRKF